MPTPPPAPEPMAPVELAPDAPAAMAAVEKIEPADVRRVWEVDQPPEHSPIDMIDAGGEDSSPRRFELRPSDFDSPLYLPDGPAVSNVAATVPPGPSSFPWGALGAVAAAAIIVGMVIGYELGVRQYLKSGSAPPVAAAAVETDVPVPATEPAASTPAPTAEMAEADAAPVMRAAARKGRVVVRSTPPGALLTIDGRPHGQTPTTVSDLALGTHKIEIARSGFAPYVDTLVLAAKNPVRTVAVHLQPGLGSAGLARDESSTAGAGSLYIDSRPRQAQVLVDGRLIGTTPLRVPDVRTGSHAVRLELVGHRSFATRVGVKAGEEVRVTAALEEK